MTTTVATYPRQDNPSRPNENPSYQIRGTLAQSVTRQESDSNEVAIERYAGAMALGAPLGGRARDAARNFAALVRFVRDDVIKRGKTALPTVTKG